MAEFIPTKAEKDAVSYLEWDNEALGKFTKYIGIIFQETSDKQDGFAHVNTAAAALCLIGACIKKNGASLIQTVDGFSFQGKSLGDWIVTVRRKEDIEISGAPIN